MGRCYVVVGLGGVGRSGVGWSRVSGFGVGRVLGAGGRSGDQKGENEYLSMENQVQNNNGNRIEMVSF